MAPNYMRWLLVPAAMLVLAVLPLPYGYYTLLRVIVTIAAGSAAYLIYRDKGFNWRVALLGFEAILFNPLFVIGLSRAVWLPIDLFCAATLFYLAFSKRGQQRSNPPAE